MTCSTNNLVSHEKILKKVHAVWMQTKNVNAARQNPEMDEESVSESPLQLQISPSTSEIKAPPLPPRLSALQRSHPHGPIGLRPPETSAYKSVPPPRPYYPPPYRMPPIPPDTYQKFGSEPFLPGTMGEVAVPLHMYSSKYPPPSRKEMTQAEWTDKKIDSPSPRIPKLAELTQRSRTSHAAVAPERGVPPPRAQMWVDERKQNASNKELILQHRWRALLNHTTDDQNQSKREPDRARMMLIEGEPLLPNSRRAISYPDGISNPGLEDEGYVPSTPNQRNEGSRGQVLLENKPQMSPRTYHAMPILSNGGNADGLNQNRVPSDWPLNGQQHPAESLQRYWPTNGLPQKHEHTPETEDTVLKSEDRENSEPTSEGQEQSQEITEPKINGNSQSFNVSPKPTKCAPYNHYQNATDLQYYHQQGIILPSDIKFPQKTMFNDKLKYNQGLLTDSFYNTTPNSRASGSSSDYDKNPHTSNTHTASESGRGTMAASVKSSSLSGGTFDSSMESSDASPLQSCRKDEQEKELHQMMKNQSVSALVQSRSRSIESTVSDSTSITPPLPPLTPNKNAAGSNSSSRLPSKYKMSLSTPTLNEASAGHLPESKEWSAQQRLPQRIGQWQNRMQDLRYNRNSRSAGSGNSTMPTSNQIRAKSRAPIMPNPSLTRLHEVGDGDMTSTTTGLDMESLLDDVSDGTSQSTDGEGSPSSDVHELRRQLEGLEQMYSEVLKMLGVKSRNGQLSQKTLSESKGKRKVHGSLSSLTGKGYASSASKTRGYADKRYMHDKRRTGSEPKGVTKRFQRLESHVVTLARSVAHLSSEMRTQHVMFQEIEGLRREVNQLTDQCMALRLNVGGGGGKPARGGASTEWDNFRSSIPSMTNPTRIKKLAKFFGDEPPLLRLFLKKLGYEKYASNFENERIGMIELPYLTEERLQKIGIPMGPRMRILQEAQMSFRQEHFNIYIV